MKSEKGILLMRTHKYEEVRRYSLEGSDTVYKVYCGADIIGVVGLVVSKKYVYINLVEIDEPHRRHGYASTIVNIIQDKYNRDIHGLSLPDAMDFWKALDVEFIDEDDVTGNVTMCGAVPFIIKYNRKRR